jgi:7-carboxy-7-deazaguanine synthase
MLNVNEIFRSIDGEVNPSGQGTLTTFIRLQGCNLNCSYCFGILPGRRIPRIITSEGKNKKLNEVKNGDKLLTFNNNKELVETIVTKTITRKTDKWLRIKINNKQYFVTEEHPFFTTKGLKKAKDLTLDDEIFHSSFQDKLSFRMKGDKNPIHNIKTKSKKIRHTNYKKTGKKISKTIKIKQKNNTYIHPYETISSEQLKRLKQNASIRMIGCKNPNWNPKSSHNYYRLTKEIKSKKIIHCSCCDSIKSLDVHHKDNNHQNDDISNLEILCESCHYSKHEMGYNFWKSPRKDGKILSTINGFKIQEIKLFDRKKIAPSIRSSSLKVYNLSCEPHNSYLVDYFWVHNCDTKHAQDSSKIMHELSVENILEIIPTGKVTITGGEPLLQKDELISLIIAFIERGQQVSVETNGSIFVPGFPHPPLLSWIIDYKLYNQDKMCIDCFWNAGSQDWVKFVIESPPDFQKAVDISSALKDGGCKARIAFSPVMKKNDMWPAQWLAERLIEKQLWDIVLNVQIHKLIWTNTTEGISLL